MFLPPAWLLKIKAENSNLKRQLKETRKFFCITQQLFLSLSKFSPHRRFLFLDFCSRREKPHLNFPAITEIAAITPEPAKQNKRKEKIFGISRSLPKIKSGGI